MYTESFIFIPFFLMNYARFEMYVMKNFDIFLDRFVRHNRSKKSILLVPSLIFFERVQVHRSYTVSTLDWSLDKVSFGMRGMTMLYD